MRKVSVFILILSWLVACMPSQESKETVDLPRPVSCSGGIPVDALADFDKPLPLFPDLDAESIPITTSSEQARQYFRQGYLLTVGFNHAEAVRSFRYALEQDPECAMCYWGLAYALGPNYNAGMQPEVVTLAHEAAKKAVKYSDGTTPMEQAIIQSIAVRYPAGPTEDRSAYDAAYTEATRKVYEQFPDNPYVASLFAEAIMDEHPWDLWEKDGQPKPWTPELISLLENTLKKYPDHPATIHLYIHATEASTQPERALAYAHKLPDLVPGAGHLVHMPSHTYIRTGDYHEGVLVNIKAVEVDSNYLTACYAAGIYPLLYFPHNYHFLTACAALEGNGALALEAADRMVERLETDIMAQPGYETIQHFWSIPMFLDVKFAKWDDILATPKPADVLIYPQAIWYYARAMAYIGKGQLKQAQQAYEQLQTYSKREEMYEIALFDINVIGDIIDIAEQVVAGELAAARGDYKTAIKHLRKGVELEDQLNYIEPPDWFFSVRHHLGPVLIAAGQYEAAEAVYREDLVTFPNTGWALSGLLESLEKQGKTEEAAQVRRQLEEAWQYADVQLAGSKVS